MLTAVFPRRQYGVAWDVVYHHPQEWLEGGMLRAYVNELLQECR